MNLDCRFRYTTLQNAKVSMYSEFTYLTFGVKSVPLPLQL